MKAELKQDSHADAASVDSFKLSGSESESVTYKSPPEDDITSTSLPGLEEWEKAYSELDRAIQSNNFVKGDKLCELLLDASRWHRRILTRPWSRMSDQKVRVWNGARLVYPNAYRVIDGIREAWVCLLMDYCKWEKAVKVCDSFIFDDSCMYLTSKAQIALNKLHALLESRRMREAFQFFQEMLNGSPRMNEILRCIEKTHTYQWHYSLARIHFLHNELEKAQHHSEMACRELDKMKNEDFDEPLQSRMWVNTIRAWTNGLICVVSKNPTEVVKVLELWEKSVCDIDRSSVANTIGLKEPSVFCRLKFVEFLMVAMRCFPELEVNTYAEASLPENSNVISIGKALLQKLRAITNELLNRISLSVEVTNARYHPLLDQAMVQLGYLSTSLEGLLNNWALVIDAGPIGNEGRFANHADDPNAVLALGEASGIRVRVLRAVKRIAKGAEVTVHYGGNYWDVVAENKKTTICQKYEAGDNSSSAPKAAVVSISGGGGGQKKKGKNGSSLSSPGEEKSFYAFKQRYEFKFFDGVVCDLNGSGLPALVLLQSLGETGTCSEAYNMELSCKKKGLKVVDCPSHHAAFPGKMLVADKNFEIGERICIYAGILTRLPEAQLKLNESDYISTVCSLCAGAYGLELEDAEAGNGMVFKKIQRELPTLTPIPPSGLYIPNAYPPSDMSQIEDIKGLGRDCTARLLDALIDNSKRDVVNRILKKLQNFPEKNWKNFAQAEVRKWLPKTRETEPPSNENKPERNRPQPKRARTEPPPLPGLNGGYWGNQAALTTTSTTPASNVTDSDEEATPSPAQRVTAKELLNPFVKRYALKPEGCPRPSPDLIILSDD